MGGRKTFYTIGGTGKKTAEDSGKYKNVAPGKFTKRSVGRLPLTANQSRIGDTYTDIALRAGEPTKEFAKSYTVIGLPKPAPRGTTPIERWHYWQHLKRGERLAARL